eukprot:scaffold56009_cov60-Phaeocystis_antarctica.AAC.1
MIRTASALYLDTCYLQYYAPRVGGRGATEERLRRVKYCTSGLGARDGMHSHCGSSHEPAQLCASDLP